MKLGLSTLTGGFLALALVSAAMLGTYLFLWPRLVGPRGPAGTWFWGIVAVFVWFSQVMSAVLNEAANTIGGPGSFRRWLRVCVGYSACACMAMVAGMAVAWGFRALIPILPPAVGQWVGLISKFDPIIYAVVFISVYVSVYGELARGGQGRRPKPPRADWSGVKGEIERLTWDRKEKKR